MSDTPLGLFGVNFPGHVKINVAAINLGLALSLTIRSRRQMTIDHVRPRITAT